MMFAQINTEETTFRVAPQILSSLIDYLVQSFSQCKLTNPFLVEVEKEIKEVAELEEESKGNVLTITLGTYDTQDAIANHFAPQTYTHPDRGDTTYTPKLKNPPPLLVIELPTNEIENKPKTIPLQLDLNNHCSPGNKKDARYTLVAVILYTTKPQHYANFSYLHGTWYFCDEFPVPGTANIRSLADDEGSTLENISKNGKFVVGDKKSGTRRTYIPNLLFYQRNDTKETTATSITSDFLALSGQLHSLGNSI